MTTPQERKGASPLGSELSDREGSSSGDSSPHTFEAIGCHTQVCWCHVDPHQVGWLGWFCPSCGCTYVEPPPRDLLGEALRIIEGTSQLLPERGHLTALWELYKLKAQAVEQLLEGPSE